MPLIVGWFQKPLVILGCPVALTTSEERRELLAWIRPEQSV